jgi:NitT/TauT family transport system ATP-binding protein
MVRWGQAALSPEALKIAMGVFRPDLYDAALGRPGDGLASSPFSAFAGPAFDPRDVGGYLASFEVGRRAP